MSVPAVSFQLAGLAAAAVLHSLRANHYVRLAKGSREYADKEKRPSRERTAKQWVFVDELDSSLGGSSPGGEEGEPIHERCEKRIEGESERHRGEV